MQKSFIFGINKKAVLDKSDLSYTIPLPRVISKAPGGMADEEGFPLDQRSQVPEAVGRRQHVVLAALAGSGGIEVTGHSCSLRRGVYHSGRCAAATNSPW